MLTVGCINGGRALGERPVHDAELVEINLRRPQQSHQIPGIYRLFCEENDQLCDLCSEFRFSGAPAIFPFMAVRNAGAIVGLSGAL